jgi:uncharacterized protein (DUF362 family)/NAD-dependent dihydropyrimidine dehydrogenase PreA subunit
MMFKLDIIKSDTIKDMKESIPAILEGYGHLFPDSKEAKILLKPNLNANMNALTGNTTDLRLLAVVMEYLKSKGYKDITVAEGTNSGYYRHHISVISRLRVDRLANYYGVKVTDLNYSEPVSIEFEGGIRASVARECFEADLFINMPKLKTHFEVGMSVCLKNLMGCLVGQENKKKTHRSLTKNILHINENLKPQLHIVDGLIAMEGLGPTRGKPKKMGLILVGTNPYLIDMVCAKIAKFDYRFISTLKLGEEKGIITKHDHEYIEGLDLVAFVKEFEKPKPNFLASFVHSTKRQRYFQSIRNTPFFNYLSSTSFFGKMLFLIGLRQDHFIKDEMDCKYLYFEKSLCKEGCTRCRDYCPIGLMLPDLLGDKKNGCIGCLYCFLVCPTQAIKFEGELGFMAEQLRQYDRIVRRIA